MSIADSFAEPAFRPRIQHPKGWEPGFTWDGTTGFITTSPLAERPTTWDEFIRDAGLDPNDVEVVGPVQVRGWDVPQSSKQGGGLVRAHYYRLSLVRRVADNLPDIRSLMQAAKAAAKRKAKEPDENPERAVVVCFADPQTGKTASRGGTAELIARTQESYARLADYIKASGATQGVWLDCGDVVESFENTFEQQQTNDLSMMGQVEVATALEFDGIDLLCRMLPRVVAAGIGSNHCRWRSGKNNMGTPDADWGLHILRQMRYWTAKMGDAYAHLSFAVPQKYDETLALDVCGQIIGLAHGHQVSNPNQIPDWWKGQSHGGQPIADADILVTGHFHHLRVEPVGRSSHTGRSRWWMQAPTLDNGSDWYRLRKGYDSDPGLLVFTVDASGWDNLRVL